MRSLLLGVFLLIGAAHARATILVPADLRDLTRDSRTIARGAVIDVESRWTDDRRSIETVVTLASEAYLKGALGPHVQFRVPGGRLGRYRKIVVGAPQFSVGDRVVVFLGVQGPSVPHVVGLSQGVFRLQRHSSGAWLVSPTPAMASAVGPVIRGNPSRAPMPLADFERDVRALAADAR